MTLQHSESEKVERLLEQQQELFTQLDDMSKQQSQLIEAQDTDRLLEVLAARQNVVDLIAQNSAFLEPYRASWESVMSSLDDVGRIRVRRRLDALAAVAERVAQRDEADRRMLEQRRDAVAGELMQVNRGRGAMAAYQTGSQPGPRLQDREA